MFSVLPFYSQSFRITARDPEFIFNIRFWKREEGDKEVLQGKSIPFIRKINIFSKAFPSLSRNMHSFFLDKIISHGLQGRLGGSFLAFLGSMLEMAKRKGFGSGLVRQPIPPAVFTQRNLKALK